MMNFSDKFTSILNPKVLKTSHQLEVILSILIFNLMGTGIFISVVFALFPKAPILLGNLIPDNYFNRPIRLLHTILYAHYFTVIYANLAVIGVITAICGTQMMSFVTNEFHVGKTGKALSTYRTSNTWRRMDNLIIQYKSTQIIHEHFMKILGFLLAPIHAVITNLILFCNYIVIRHRHEVHPSLVAMLMIWSIFGTVFWSILLKIGGLAFLHGKKVLHSWMVHDWGTSFNNRLMMRFRLSCKPFMINYGSTYVITRVSVLKFLKGGTKGTFKILLTLGSKK